MVQNVVLDRMKVYEAHSGSRAGRQPEGIQRPCIAVLSRLQASTGPVSSDIHASMRRLEQYLLCTILLMVAWAGFLVLSFHSCSWTRSGTHLLLIQFLYFSIAFSIPIYHLLALISTNSHLRANRLGAEDAAYWRSSNRRQHVLGEGV